MVAGTTASPMLFLLCFGRAPRRGARSGTLRKTPLMRVEHDGCYAAVASRD